MGNNEEAQNNYSRSSILIGAQMKRTIRHLGIEYLNPNIFSFTRAAGEQVGRMRAAFPDKTITFDWGYGVKVHDQDGGIKENLGDLLVVGFASAGERSTDPAIVRKLDGEDIEISIPADVTAAETPTIDVDSEGRLVLRS